MATDGALDPTRTGLVVVAAAWVVAAASLFVAAPGAAACLGDPGVGTLEGSPLDDLPPHISLVVPFGQRPDWSPDGKTLAFLDRANDGNVWAVDVATGATRNLTGGFTNHQGFTRAHFLRNGDLLLCGPTSGPRPTPERPEDGRFNGVLWVLRAPFRKPPQPLGMSCWEGLAVSKSTPEIAWNRSHIDYTDPDLASQVVFGISEIWTGKVAGRDLLKVRKAIDRSAFSAFAVLEVQDFRPGSAELIFTNYVNLAGGSEVFGLDRDSGEVRNYSRSPCYEEAEGIFPDGGSILVERDLTSILSPQSIDIWRLSLDGRSTFERLTHFNRYRGFYASNPVVHPDGSRFAFQLSIEGGSQGDGDGILVFDLARYAAGP